VPIRANVKLEFVILKKRTKILKQARNGKTRRVPALMAHAVFLAAGMVLMWAVQAFLSPEERWPHSGANHKTSAYRQAAHRSPQPWGDLQYLPIALSRPEAYLTNLPPISDATRWVLNSMSEGGLSELLEAFELDGRAEKFLTDRSHWEPWQTGFKITVPPEVLLDIPGDTRQKLYALLAQSPENSAQRNPFRFRGGGIAQWFVDSELPQDKIDVVRKLSYTNEDTLCFADIAAFAQLSTAAETTLLLKTLSRVPTFLLKVEIDPSTKIEALLSYWGKFGKAHEMRQFVQSVSRADSELNVSFFLPSFARLRLYTYPRVEDPQGNDRNDLWTAMNFFTKKPDDRFLDPQYVEAVLNSDYIRVPSKDKQFGDVIVFAGERKKIVRMSIYLADDFVFTKRAKGIFEPWLITTIKELIAESSSERPFEVRVYRQKGS
jgi:hypothetical protein